MFELWISVYRQWRWIFTHYTDVIMSRLASQITSLTVVYSIVYSDADQRKHQSSAYHWPLCGEFLGDRWIPRTNDQLRWKCSHLMTSSWCNFRPPKIKGIYISIADIYDIYCASNNETNLSISIFWDHNLHDGDFSPVSNDDSATINLATHTQSFYFPPLDISFVHIINRK